MPSTSVKYYAMSEIIFTLNFAKRTLLLPVGLYDYRGHARRVFRLYTRPLSIALYNAPYVRFEGGGG